MHGAKLLLQKKKKLTRRTRAPRRHIVYTRRRQNLYCSDVTAIELKQNPTASNGLIDLKRGRKNVYFASLVVEGAGVRHGFFGGSIRRLLSF